MDKTELVLTDEELDRIADKVVEKLQNANIEKSKIKTGICPTCGKTAKRKYLNEIGITSLHDHLNSDDERWEQWNKEIEECGWFTYENALRILNYENDKYILNEAIEFFKSNK